MFLSSLFFASLISLYKDSGHVARNYYSKKSTRIAPGGLMIEN